MSIKITNGQLVDPKNNINKVCDIFIDGGEIVAIGDEANSLSADTVIDSSDRLVLPGLIDLSARLREPGQEYKATIASETKAAVSAGITTLTVPPDTAPVIDTPAVVELIKEKAEQAGNCKVVTIAALTQGLNGELISEMSALKTAGCVGISNVNRPMKNSRVLRRAFEYAATQNLRLFLNPEDRCLADGGCAHEGTVSTELGLPGIPDAAESAAVAWLLVLIEQVGIQAHFGQLSSAKAVEMLLNAAKSGLPVTFDVAAHQLLLTEDSLRSFDSNYHLRPPLRSNEDRLALQKALPYMAVCSNHQPHDADAKLAPFANTEPGASSLETLLPILLKMVKDKVVSLSEAVAAVTSHPAAILGLEQGDLAIGKPADITIVDPEISWQLTTESMLSRGKNSPFIGKQLQGRPVMTIVDGNIVFSADE